MHHRNDPPLKHRIRSYDRWLDILFVLILILLAVLILLISVFVNLRN